MIALDASVLLAAEDSDDAHHAAAVSLLETRNGLATLDLAAWEAINVALRRWGDREAARRLGERVFAIARLGRLVRVDHELAEATAEIAAEHGISGYDAGYVAAARRLGVPLASCDERDLVGRDLAQLPGALAR